MAADDSTAFASFFEEAEPRLRTALSGAFGVESGRDAAAEALAWGWENWSELAEMDNPIGYLYRVGRTHALRGLRRREFPTDTEPQSPATERGHVEPRLLPLLRDLPERQRVAVWLIHGLGYSHRETAEILGCSKPTASTHVRRGLASLRSRLEVDSGV